MSKVKTIVIVGNHAGTGIGLAKAILSYNEKSKVYLFAYAQAVEDISSISWEQENLNIIIKEYRFKQNESLPSFKKYTYKIHNFLYALYCVYFFLRSDVLISLTGSFLDSPVWSFLLIKYKIKEYYAFATGSDIREEALKNNTINKVYTYFSQAKKILLLNVDMINLISQLRFQHCNFFPFAIDTQKYIPDPNYKFDINKPITFFMPSNLDWGKADNIQDRTSTKGNDKFIRAFAKALEKGLNGKLILLDRGPDKENAKHLISTLNIAKNVTFLSGMKKKDLVNMYQNSDIIVDQFIIGSFGTIGLEAMSCGKPLMIYINEDCASICYSNQLPPIINVKTEEEIYKALIKILEDPIYLIKLGEQARKWILQKHSLKVVGQKLYNINGNDLYS